MSILHIAQVNIGRIKASLEDPIMAGFVNRLDEINALADRSAGYCKTPRETLRICVRMTMNGFCSTCRFGKPLNS